MTSPVAPSAPAAPSSPEAPVPCSDAPESTSEPASVTHSVDIQADPQRVWDALITDAGLSEWMGEGATIDSRPDGELTVPDVVTGTPRRGRISSIDQEHHISYEWWPAQDPSDRTQVTIDLEPVPAGTRVTVTETLTASLAIASNLPGDWASVNWASVNWASVNWAWRTALLLVSHERRMAWIAA